jgi:hypothetical protein
MHNNVKNLLLGDSPCSIGKIGVIELMHFYDGYYNNELILRGETLAVNAGININSLEEYNSWIKDFGDSIKNLDCILSWQNNDSEKQIVKELFKGEFISEDFRDLEPFSHGKDGWHYHLKDKKVLVISSLKNSIEKQIPNFGKIWEGAELGSCEVIESRNPYQITGEDPFFYKDEIWRIASLISKKNFDICIIGAGGYSLPLCNFVKSIGKKAIHLGGATQVLFGIRGSRFDRNFKYENWYGGENFIYPVSKDIPKKHYMVENSCYW